MRRACALACSLFIALALQWGVADPAAAKKPKPTSAGGTTTSVVQESPHAITRVPSRTLRVHGSW